MALEMKPKCEKCSKGLPANAEACICSYECTFCPECTKSMRGNCQNCGGELVPRPKRTR